MQKKQVKAEKEPKIGQVQQESPLQRTIVGGDVSLQAFDIFKCG